MAHRYEIGFVGLGHIGWPMAANLVAAGYPVVAHDADRERGERFAAEYDCPHVVTPMGLAEADAIVTMLPNGAVVREVLLRSGLVDQLSSGTLVLDTSSSDPLGTRKLGSELAQRGIQLVDAGVSLPEGGRAAERMITFVVGADDEDAFERASVLLEAMGNRIFRLGPLGAGHAMKTLNNYVGAAGLAAALDALVVGCGYGLDPATMLDVLNVSTGRNFSTELPLRERAVTRRFDSGYALSLLIKDLRIAAKVAERVGFESDLFGVLEEEFSAAEDALGGNRDHLLCLEHWEQRAGLRLPTGKRERVKGEKVQSDTIGFVGIGNAGWPMAANLVKQGHRVIVYDIDLDRVERFAAEHGTPGARTLSELADVDVLFTMVFDGHAVREVLLEGDRLADRLRPGTVVIDTTSADPNGTRELGAELARRDIHLVDAGVSMKELGGRESGRITFMVGGDDETAVERAVAILDQISEYVFVLGRLGAGHAMKTLNNYISACGLMAALDALMVGFDYGLDPATMLDALNVSTGRNFSTEQTLKYHSLPRDFHTGYTLELLVKDLRIAAGLADSVQFDSDLFRLVCDSFAQARDDIGGDADLTASLRHWEHQTGQELPSSALAAG